MKTNWPGGAGLSERGSEDKARLTAGYVRKASALNPCIYWDLLRRLDQKNWFKSKSV